MGVEKKQFVTHLWTLFQKVSSLSCIFRRGVKRSAPYRSTGAMREEARRWQRYRGETFPRGRQAFNGIKGPLGNGKSPRKVWISGERGGKPIAEPPDFFSRREVQIVQPNPC